MTPDPEDAAASRFQSLSDELQLAFRSWNGEEWSEEKFNGLALRLFAFQFDHCSPYRRYCESRGIDPTGVDSWQQIPAVPTEAFRHVELRSIETDAELKFRTSGTSRGERARGTHVVPDPRLYSVSLRRTFETLVGAVGPQSVPPLMVSLVPPFATDGDSSLAWMIDDLMTAFGAAGSRSVGSAEAIDWAEAVRICSPAADSDSSRGPGTQVSIHLLGTTLAFAGLLDFLEAENAFCALPPGSLLMDTGGSKGMKELDRGAMLARLLPRLALPESQAVNEFGMTELLSQRYGRGPGPTVLEGPPWLRTLVLDPVTLEPRPAGEEGILCHYDLANAGSVIGVLTEDRGSAERQGIHLLGRTPGAPPRGCSLATAEILAAAEKVP
jgi:hypothetical protein